MGRFKISSEKRGVSANENPQELGGPEGGRRTHGRPPYLIAEKKKPRNMKSSFSERGVLRSRKSPKEAPGAKVSSPASLLKRTKLGTKGSFEEY